VLGKKKREQTETTGRGGKLKTTKKKKEGGPKPVPRRDPYKANQSPKGGIGNRCEKNTKGKRGGGPEEKKGWNNPKCRGGANKTQKSHRVHTSEKKNKEYGQTGWRHNVEQVQTNRGGRTGRNPTTTVGLQVKHRWVKKTKGKQAEENIQKLRKKKNGI